MSDPNLTIVTETSDVVEIISPKHSLCEVDGCYHSVINDKLCKEHHTYISLNYLVAHKPMQSPVAASKYSMEQRGLSCVQLHTEESE
jgi:hypothetical protein